MSNNTNDTNATTNDNTPHDNGYAAVEEPTPKKFERKVLHVPHYESMNFSETIIEVKQQQQQQQQQPSASSPSSSALNGITKYVIEQGDGPMPTPPNTGSKIKYLHSGYILLPKSPADDTATHDNDDGDDDDSGAKHTHSDDKNGNDNNHSSGSPDDEKQSPPAAAVTNYEIIGFDDGYSLQQVRLFKRNTFLFFEKCLYSMRSGEKAWFRIGPDFSMLNRESLMRMNIPSVANLTIPDDYRVTLLYYFEVVSVENKKVVEPKNLQERIAFASQDRLMGNESYKAGKYREAASCYGRAKMLLDAAKDVSDDEYPQLLEEQVKVHLNLIKTSLALYDQLMMSVQRKTEGGGETTIASTTTTNEKSDKSDDKNQITPLLSDEERVEKRNLALKELEKATVYCNYHPLRMHEASTGQVKYLRAKIYYAKGDLERAKQCIDESVEQYGFVNERSRQLKSFIDRRIERENDQNVQYTKRTMRKMFDHGSEGLYADAQPFSQVDEWRRMQEEDERLGRKVWFTSTGEEFYEQAVPGSGGARFEDVTSSV